MATELFRPSRTYPPRPDIATAGQLWRHVPLQRRLEAARAFWADTQAESQHAEAVLEMARLLKFRPQSMYALPIEKKTRHLASLANLSDAIASQVLVTYHLATKRPMMQAFLDALGIAHEDGVIAAPAELKAPDPKSLQRAVAAIAERFPHDDVHLYLSTLLVQDAEVWGGVAAHLQALSDSGGDKSPQQA